VLSEKHFTSHAYQLRMYSQATLRVLVASNYYKPNQQQMVEGRAWKYS